jgi:hypothetical protein
VILLAGRGKSAQDKDIKTALKLGRGLQEKRLAGGARRAPLLARGR